MKKETWNNGLNNIDGDLVEEFAVKCEKIEANKKTRNRLLRFAAIAACLCFIAAAVIAPFGKSPNIPIVDIGAPSHAPLYYGDESSVSLSDMGTTPIPFGISVTAQITEILPDTYTFFDDWAQSEYRLLKMKTVTLLRGKEMTGEFYYIVPVGFMADFSVFDTFVITDMGQFGYEYSVVYNKTQDCAERLDLVLFGYSTLSYRFMGKNFMAFDADGNFDSRLWESTEKWIASTSEAESPQTLGQAEEKVRQLDLEELPMRDNAYVHSLKDITGEAADVLAQIMTLENGIYVQNSSQKLWLSPEVQLQAVRYINGFPTNEKVSIYSKEWYGSEEDIFSFTEARFTEEDLNALPNLKAAIAAVAKAYDAEKSHLRILKITKNSHHNIINTGFSVGMQKRPTAL
ncbi:MAG: hypothetical protein IJX55_00600 [Clostridia bacterium]|nr:hypothetical protein [Clostridia bacterium]